MLTDEQKKKMEEVEAKALEAEKAKKAYEIAISDATTAKEDANQAKANTLAAAGWLPPIVGSRSDSIEQKSMRSFGCTHVKQLIDVNTGHPTFRMVPDDQKQAVRDLKLAVDTSRLMQQICGGQPLDRSGKFEDNLSNVKGIMDGSHYAKGVTTPMLKAFATDASPAQEWVPTLISSQHLEEFELGLSIPAQFPEVKMPGKNFEIPKQDGLTVGRLQSENASMSDVTFGTDVIAFAAKKISEHYVLSEEITMDSAPDILRLARDQVVKAVMRAVERAILDGDITGPHMDSDVLAADDARKAWNGLRKKALDNGATIDFAAGAATTALLRDMRALTDKFGINPKELMFIAPPKVYYQMVDLDEVTTYEKFGPLATIQTGTLEKLDGMDIFQSQWLRTDLNAAGIYDGVTTTQSVMHLVRKDRFFAAVRQALRVRAVPHPVPPNDQWLLWSSWRGDFNGHEQDANEATSILGFNIS